MHQKMCQYVPPVRSSLLPNYLCRIYNLIDDNKKWNCMHVVAEKEGT
jgi:hypothetical protein